MSSTAEESPLVRRMCAHGSVRTSPPNKSQPPHPWSMVIAFEETDSPTYSLTRGCVLSTAVAISIRSRLRGTGNRVTERAVEGAPGRQLVGGPVCLTVKLMSSASQILSPP